MTTSFLLLRWFPVDTEIITCPLARSCSPVDCSKLLNAPFAYCDLPFAVCHKVRCQRGMLKTVVGESRRALFSIHSCLADGMEFPASLRTSRNMLNLAMTDDPRGVRAARKKIAWIREDPSYSRQGISQ